MINHLLTLCSAAFLLHLNLVSATCRNFTGGGLRYVGHLDKCMVAGSERFLLEYKSKLEVNMRNATKTYECQLCDPFAYLDCYNNPANKPDDPTGECDCLRSHTRGYVLVYDKKAEECRGYVNSTCGRSMLCHTGLECVLGTCRCETSGGPTNSTAIDCANIPTPRPMVKYTVDGAIIGWRTSSFNIFLLMCICWALHW